MITCTTCKKKFTGLEYKEDTCPECLKEIMKPKTMKNILVPFEGFYESQPSNRVEETAFHNFISENDIPNNPETGWLDVPGDMSDEDQQKFWDYYDEHRDELRKEVAEAYLKALSGELGIELKFESISSPRYYNFTTDRLFVNVDENELMHLYNRTQKDILADMIKENHTSGPGFDSYYENDINHESWTDPAKYDHNQWCTVIDAYVKQNEIDLSELYYI